MAGAFASLWLTCLDFDILCFLQLKIDDRPPHVISVLTEQLNYYEEYDWLETITAEMVEGASLLKNFSEAMAVLQDTLALPGLTEDFLAAQFAVRDYACVS